MRALDTMEIGVLRDAGCGRPIVDPEVDDAVERCVSRGLMRWIPLEDGWVGTQVTPLGHLALRVSIPGAPVPL